jgi:biotin carboxylase
MKKALLLCTSHNDLGLIRALRKLGYYIIATGNRENSPGEKWVDKYIKADYSDKDLILSIAKEEKIDVICQCCNDFGVYTASFVAEKLNLPGYDSYENTLILHNKDKFKEFSRIHDILTPKTESFDNEESALEAIREMDFPLIVKPTDASAGNGINKVVNYDEAVNAVKEAFGKSRAKRIVVEPYIDGTQHGFCTFLVNRKVVACCTNNEYSILNPYRVEIDTFPADNWEKAYPILVEQIEKIANILQLKDGIFHLQYIMQDGKPWIIEVMRRVLGNMYSVPANMLNGIDWDYWEVRAKCGLDCGNIPHNINQEGCYAYKAIMADKNGIINNISIPDNYKKYIYDEFMLMDKGDIVTDYRREPIGFLFMMFSNPNEMRRVLIDEYRCDLVDVGV